MTEDLYGILTFIGLLGAFISTWSDEFEMLQIFWTCTTGSLIWWVFTEHIANGLSVYSVGPILLVAFFAAFLNKLADDPRGG